MAGEEPGMSFNIKMYVSALVHFPDLVASCHTLEVFPLWSPVLDFLAAL